MHSIYFTAFLLSTAAAAPLFPRGALSGVNTTAVAAVTDVVTSVTTTAKDLASGLDLPPVTKRAPLEVGGTVVDTVNDKVTKVTNAVPLNVTVSTTKEKRVPLEVGGSVVDTVDDKVTDATDAVPLTITVSTTKEKRIPLEVDGTVVNTVDDKVTDATDAVPLSVGVSTTKRGVLDASAASVCGELPEGCSTVTEVSDDV